MPRKPKHKPEPEPVDQVEQAYDNAMADIYDLLMDTYDKVGVRVKELLEEVQYMDDEIEVELELDEDDDIDY
jgi:translation elongation factor P/translation initiation factor 5A